MMLGREGAFREKVLDLVRLKTGESVLDVGWGQVRLRSLRNDASGQPVRSTESTPRRK
jgi:hypothetical protein